MSSTNKTPYFNLPQFIGTDIPTWLGDFNGAMSDIDTALKTNADRADLASTQAGQAVNTANAANDAASALQTAMTGLGNRVTACEETDTAQSTQISGLSGNVSDLDGRVTALEQGGGGGVQGIMMSSLGSYTGAVSGLKSNTVLSNSGFDTESNKVIGILVELNIGNAYGYTFLRGTSALANSFSFTIEAISRIYTSASKYSVNMTINSLSAGARTVGFVSSIRETFTCGSGNTGTPTVSYGYNKDGVSDSSSDTVTLNLYAITTY